MSNSERNITTDAIEGGKDRLRELLDVRVPGGVLLGATILEVTSIKPEALIILGAVFVVSEVRQVDCSCTTRVGINSSSVKFIYTLRNKCRK